jgi:hypothetical protein
MKFTDNTILIITITNQLIEFEYRMIINEIIKNNNWIFGIGKTVTKPRDTIFNIDQIVSEDVENRKSSSSDLSQFQTVVIQVNI